MTASPPWLPLMLFTWQVFRSRIGSMRKGLKSRLEFEFVEGPYEVVRPLNRCMPVVYQVKSRSIALS